MTGHKLYKKPSFINHISGLRTNKHHFLRPVWQGSLAIAHCGIKRVILIILSTLP